MLLLLLLLLCALLVQVRRFALYGSRAKDLHSAIRTAPAYPGERTDQYVEVGDAFAFTSTQTVTHAHSDGHEYTITFYQLADGRGWVHDFNDQPEKRDTPCIAILVRRPLFSFVCFII